MKKFGKVFALLAAGAMLFGTALLGCSSDDGGSSDDTPSIAISGDTSVKVGETITLTSNVEGVAWSSSDEAKATVSDAGVVTGVAEGSVTITAKKEGYKDGTKVITVGNDAGGGVTDDYVRPDVGLYYWNFADSYTVLADKLTVTTGTAGQKDTKYTLTADSKLKSSPEGIDLVLKAGDYNRVCNADILTAGDAVVTACQSICPDNDKTHLKGGIESLANVDAEFVLEGPFTVSAAVGANSSSDKTDRYAYIKINGEEVVAPTKSSTTLPANGQILTYEYTGYDKVTVGVGATGIVRIMLITADVKQGKEKQTAPALTSFTANSTKDGYSITVGSDIADPTTLEYSTDGTTYTAVTSSTISLTTFGTVKIRYAETETKGASPAVSVTVEEYSDASLSTPEAPAATSFTVTKAVDGEDGKIETTLTGIEYVVGDSTDYAAIPEGGITGLAAGTVVKVRVAAVEGVSNASPVTELTVEQGFNARTIEVTNDVATLGLVGTKVTSGDETKVTAAIADGKVVITAVAEATDDVTVKVENADSTEEKVVAANIKVKVSKGGQVTQSNLSKCVRAAPVKGTDYEVEGKTLTAKTAIEYSVNGTNYEVLAENGTYTTTEVMQIVTVRFAAVEGAYEVSKTASVTLANIIDSFDFASVNPNTTLTGSAAYISTNIEIKGSKEVATMTLVTNGTGKGKTVVSEKNKVAGKESNWPAFRWVEAQGLCVKRDGIKIENVPENSKVVIAYYQNSTSDRNLEVTVGDGTCVETAAGTVKGPRPAYTADVAAASTVYIGASNELYITSVTIVSAE